MLSIASRFVGGHYGAARRALAFLSAGLLVAGTAGIVVATPGFAAKASVQPVVQYLNDTAGTTFTFTIDNTGDVSIGAVEISRPSPSWTVTACPLAPAGWTTQRADTKCRYRSADTAADDIQGGTSSSAFQLTATVVPGSQNIVGTWSVVVSKTNLFNDKSKLKTAASEPPGLTITAYTFQILDAVVVGSAPAPGSACPAATPANHSAGTGATGQVVAICGKNRANLALTPVAGQSSLGGDFIASAGTFSSGSIAANSASSIVLGSWSNVTVVGTSGPGKSIVAGIGSSSTRTSPSTTLDDTCPATQLPGTACIANGGYEAIDDAPFVTSTNPLNGAANVAINTNIVVDFSESVSASTSSFTLECPSGTPKSFTVSGSPGSTITLDPTADLPQGTTCTVRVIANQISDTDLLDPPDHMTADYSFSFTTDSAPAVTSTSPANGATGVDPSGDITITFSEPVIASGSALTVECPAPGNAQAFSVSGSGTSTITLDPTADLPATTVCTVTVIANQISDVDSGDPPDHMAADYVFSFTTQDNAPSVVSTSPADGADHVATNTSIVVNFSESVSASTSSFTLECPSGTPKSFTVSGSPGTSITLDPTSDLPEGTICTVTVIANQISDTDAVDPPDNLAADYPFSFTTDAAPSVTTTTPADGDTNVDPTADITVNFSEPVNVTTSSFDILCGEFTHLQFGVSGSGTDSIMLDPTTDLPSTASCTVTAIAANISDVDAGDPPDHPAADYPFSFTTTDAAPSVTSTSPFDGATNVARNTTIVVHFSEPVTASTSSFTLECPLGTSKSFTVSGSPGADITLTPDASLPQGETCTVTVIANQVSDVDVIDPPDNMAADYVFSFGIAANQAPTDISLSNSSVDENQPTGTTVGTFSTTDPDAGDSFTYSLVSGTGDTDNGSFQIVGDTLKTNAVFDFETKSSYSIRVQSTDSGSLSVEKVFTITINDLNEPPTDITLSNSSIDENQPPNTTIGTLTATDPDTGQTHTFSLQSSGCSGSFPDNSSFSISGGDLQSAVSFDFEVKSSYTICIRTTDNGSPNLSFDKQFTITINDVNDPPVANPDNYSGAIGNTLAVLGTTGSGPNVVLTGNVLTSNDTDEDQTFPHTISAVPGTVASTGGGTATINADGSFTFLPGVGDKNQDDTFTYTITDGTAQSTGTVTVHIDDFLVWYVNNALGSNGDGRSSSPFNVLGSLNSAGGSGDSDGPNDYIFLYQGSGSYAGGIPLEANQKLFGEKNGLTVNGHVLVTAGATPPTITNAAGVGVGLANGVDVEGLNISGTSGDAINGFAITTATVGTTTAVAISGAGGDGVDLSGAASGNITIAASITGSTGHSVTLSGRSGGTTAFSGSISDTGTGILLSGNTGATINLTGGVTASTGTNNAFAATGGGTVNVTGSNNTLATTTGTALNVTSTTIGASGLTFKSIASNGAANGIVLSNTGSSGGLTVTGDGSNTSQGGNGSGGTIANATGSDGTTAGIGVYLNNTSGVTLRRMTINGTNQNFGIRGTGVTNFTLEYSTVAGVNGTSTPNREGSVIFDNLFGSNAITGSVISGSIEDNVRVENTTGTLTAFNLTNSKIQNNSTVSGNVGFRFATATPGVTMTGTVSGSTFQGNRTIAIQTDASNGTVDFTATNNIIISGTGGNNQGNQGIEVDVANNGVMTFDVSGNKVGTDGITNQPLLNTGINIFNGTLVTSGTPASITGTVTNNTVYNAGAGQSGFGIRLFNQGYGTMNANVSGNTVNNVGFDYGIFAEVSSNSGTANATGHSSIGVTNNTSNVLSGALDAIRVQARGNSVMCARISGNASTTTGTGFFGLEIRQASQTVNSVTYQALFNLEGLTSGLQTNHTTIVNYLISQNPSIADGVDEIHSAGITGVASNSCSSIP